MLYSRHVFNLAEACGNAMRARQNLWGEIMTERWLSVEEIASHLGVKPDTIYKWIVRKGLPARKVGRLWKFKVSQVDEWVQAGCGRAEAT